MINIFLYASDLRDMNVIYMANICTSCVRD